MLALEPPTYVLHTIAGAGGVPPSASRKRPRGLWLTARAHRPASCSPSGSPTHIAPASARAQAPALAPPRTGSPRLTHRDAPAGRAMPLPVPVPRWALAPRSAPLSTPPLSPPPTGNPHPAKRRRLVPPRTHSAPPPTAPPANDAPMNTTQSPPLAPVQALVPSWQRRATRRPSASGDTAFTLDD
jgi:hypothetical protein